MSRANTSQPDPFRCYLGTRVRRGEHDCVVEDHIVQERELLFRLRELGSGREALVTLIELIELEGR